MALFIPTSGSMSSDSQVMISKGQLYALEYNEYFNFQFNPAKLAEERDFNWSRTKFKGDNTGGQPNFNTAGPIIFDLDLLFVADPAAPSFEYHAQEQLAGLDGVVKVDFEALMALIRRWQTIIPGKNRPTTYKVILGEFDFNCILKRYEITRQDFFHDLDVREGRLLLTFETYSIL